MSSTLLQEAQRNADDLALQLELLASTAEIYSHAQTPEAVRYGLSWIQTILQRDILRTLSMNIEDIDMTLDRDSREGKDTALDTHRQGGLDRAEKPRKDNA